MDKSRGKIPEEDYRDIVGRIKGGNVFAVTEWVEGRKDKLFRIVQEYAPVEACDGIIEKAVIRIFQNIKELSDEKLFEPYALSIIMDECKKGFAPPKNRPASGEDEVSCDNGGSPAAALKAMAGPEKDAVVLKYYGGYSIDEISGIMAETCDEVRHNIYLGLKKISPA